jgi:hypothetical protein
MPTDPTKINIGSLVSVEQGSYYCMNTRQFVEISSEAIGIVVHLYWYDQLTYPWKILGYKYLADIIIGQYKLRDVPNFKVNEVRGK